MQRIFRWLKVATSLRLLTYLALEHYRYALRPGLAIVSASHALQATMAKTYPRAISAMQVVTPGVFSVPGTASPSEKLAARCELGLPSEGACIIFVGNDYRKKGLPVLLQALVSLPADTYLAVVGNPAQIAGVQEEVRLRGVSGRVFFLGALSRVEVAYQAADCLAHPTLEDTFGMVVLEAMSHGLPVVVSAPQYCGVAELLSEGANALILENPRDPNQLSLALDRVLFDDALRTHLVAGGRKFANAHRWADSARAQERIYRQVVLA